MGRGCWDKSSIPAVATRRRCCVILCSLKNLLDGSAHVQSRTLPQKHYVQSGILHITTNTQNGVPWCTWKGIPEILIDNLVATRNLYNGKIYAFCILPSHMHILLNPGEKGVSTFMHSFKRNSSKDIRYILNRAGNRTRAAFYGHDSCNRRLYEQNIRNRGLHERNTRSRGSVTSAAPEQQFTGWQKGFYDEIIEDNRQRDNAYDYIVYNPIRHSLVENINNWSWSSIHFPNMLDPMEI